MTRWEYRTIIREAPKADDERSVQAFQTALDGDGARGWELVAGFACGPDQVALVFKMRAE